MINSTYACENPALLNGLLKTEMGFRGYVQSDWQATMSTLAAAEGLDMSMPGDVSPLLSLRSAGSTLLCLCLDVPFHLYSTRALLSIRSAFVFIFGLGLGLEFGSLLDLMHMSADTLHYTAHFQLRRLLLRRQPHCICPERDDRLRTLGRYGRPGHGGHVPPRTRQARLPGGGVR
jgi:hypothetical protein